MAPPSVSLDFSYLLTNVTNESGLGFTVNQNVSIISGFLSEQQDDRNYYISIAPDGSDNAGFAGARQVYGFGNGFITSYGVEAAVGGFPTASIGVEAYNFRAYGSGSGASPAISEIDGTAISTSPFVIPTATTGAVNQVSTLRPGDISFSLAGLNTVGVDPVDLKIQSFKMSVELGRDSITALGQLYPKAKPLKAPITSKIDILCNDSEYTLSVTMKTPACAPAQGLTGVKFDFRGAKLAGQNFSSSIGPNKTVSLSFTAQASGPQDARGIFLSGLLQ